MKSPEDVTKDLRTKSAKIRALALEGYSRTEIASFLEIRYQHVRNVLMDAASVGAKSSVVVSADRQAFSEEVTSASSSQSVHLDWFWEGNVQVMLGHHLEMSGWRLVSVSDTASKARGIDIQAEKDGQILLFEVKGYPSAVYRDPKRAQEKKKTSPILQAGHWYAQAILKAMRMKSSLPSAQVVIGLPEFKRYKDLFGETKSSLQLLGFQVWGVDEDGVVSIW